MTTILILDDLEINPNKLKIRDIKQINQLIKANRIFNQVVIFRAYSEYMMLKDKNSNFETFELN